jgi:sugar lactone lactonase YvrE
LDSILQGMRVNWVACAIVLSLPLAAKAQSLTFNTLAGYPGHLSEDGPSGKGRFNNPQGVAADTNGNLYVADTGSHIIRKIDKKGTSTTLAGLTGVSGSADGTNSDARFNTPYGVAVDSGGNVYVADSGNHTIREITPAGAVTTLAGLAGTSGSGNGTGSGARFFQPEGVAVDTSGNVYVADTYNHTIRKVTPGGSVSTFAGTAGSFGTNDGSGSAALFYQPQGVAVDGSGNVYVADSGNHTVRKLTAGGASTTLAGNPLNYGSADGIGGGAFFYAPQGVAVDAVGTVYVADTLNHIIRQVSSGGSSLTLVGSAGNYGSADGALGNARFWMPGGLAVSGTNIYVADTQNGTIRKVAIAGGFWVATTVAGSASIGYADGLQNAARFFWPAGAAADTAGNTYVADTENSTIRRSSLNGTVSAFAGLPQNPGSADGLGANARFKGPQGVAVDGGGNIYVADTGNHTIRKITPGATVSTLAGSPGVINSYDGTGPNANFNGPQALAVDGSGNVFVADTLNHTIRKVTSGGVVTTLAGLAGNFGSTDGTNSSARFYLPSGVAADGSGNIYVADTYNHVIRKVTSSGSVSTLAGMAGVWGGADGTNTGARFFQPQGIGVDASGVIYVADSGNHAVRKLVVAGTNCTVTTVAGLAGVSGTTDGSGTSARFNYSSAATVDGSGYIYLADAGNNTIRVDRVFPTTLQIFSSGNQVSIYWPISPIGMVLEVSTSLGASAVWTPVTNGFAISGNDYVLSGVPGGTTAFYRLHKP